MKWSRIPHGMTVIELVVVVALVGIIAGVVAPSFASFDRRATTRSGAETLDALLRLGRRTAVERATAVNITIDPVSKRFWLDPPESTAVLTLPDNAALVSRAQRVHVRIEPNGTATIDEPLFVRDANTTLPITIDR